MKGGGGGGGGGGGSSDIDTLMVSFVRRGDNAQLYILTCSDMHVLTYNAVREKPYLTIPFSIDCVCGVVRNHTQPCPATDEAHAGSGKWLRMCWGSISGLYAAF